MPAAAADRSDAGIASAIRSRSGVVETSRKRSRSSSGVRTTGGQMKERRRSWADLSGWQIDRDSASPLFRQVYHQVQSAILAQSLQLLLRQNQQKVDSPGC